MIFVLIALWSTALLLLILNPKHASVRWLSGVSFCGGAGAFAAVIGDRLLPYFRAVGESREWIDRLELMMTGASIVSYYGLPYTFLMFAFAFHPPEFYSSRKGIWPWLLLLPIAAMFVFTPVYTVQHPYLYKWLAAWALPYFAFGTWLMLTKRDQHPLMQRTDRLTSLAVLSPVLFSAIMNYLLPSLGYYEMWRYNTWMIAFAFSVFIISLFTYGFLGIQLYIRRRQLDSTMRAITSGTSMLNHAIKNDVGKLKLFADKIHRHAEKTGQTELLDDIAVVIRSASHIQDMINRVQDQIQETVVRKEVVDLTALLEEAVAAIRPYCDQINIRTHWHDVPLIEGDRSHLSEVFHNVLMNAVEAMPDGGELEIRTYPAHKKVMVEVRDNGCGIERKHLKKMMEPFFTTKGGRQNFGLGLAYCYNVMAKHRGGLSFESEPGKGTTVYMHFPIPKPPADRT